jgi:hypothetical protein
LICTGRYRVVHSRRCSLRAICSGEALRPHPSHGNSIEVVISINNSCRSGFQACNRFSVSSALGFRCDLVHLHSTELYRCRCLRAGLHTGSGPLQSECMAMQPEEQIAGSAAMRQWAGYNSRVPSRIQSCTAVGPRRGWFSGTGVAQPPPCDPTAVYPDKPVPKQKVAFVTQFFRRQTLGGSLALHAQQTAKLPPIRIFMRSDYKIMKKPGYPRATSTAGTTSIPGSFP